MARSIGVFGGNGLLGRAICEAGVKRGYDVTSFSRSGSAPESIAQRPWATLVNWEKANIFNPETYKHKLGDLDAVVHSIGIIFENIDYKKALNSNSGLVASLQNVAELLKGANPMKKSYETSYAAIQRDSALLLAESYLKEKKSGKPTYVYISADQLLPLIPKGYLATKREAEQELFSIKKLRTIIMRPGFMYPVKLSDDNFEGRDILQKILSFGNESKNAVFGDSMPLLNSIIRPIVSTKAVSEVLYDKIEEKNFDGIVTLDEMVEVK